MSIKVNAQPKAVNWEKINVDVKLEYRATKNKIVQVGEQQWMSKNLEVTQFRNGDEILDANSDMVWQKAGYNQTPAWCWAMPGQPEFGKLYNSFAVNDPRGIAPEGWHVPTVEEWKKLYIFLGGNNDVMNKISSKAGWMYPSPKATNSSLLTIRPTGWRSANTTFFNTGDKICLWAASNGDDCDMFTILDYIANLQTNRTVILSHDCRDGAAIRLIKDVE